MGTVSEYIGRNTILKILADSEPKEKDWRTDNMEGYDLRKIRFLAASNVYEEIKEVLSCKRLIADVNDVYSIHHCSTCGRNADNGGMYEDGRTMCPIQEHYALLRDGFCHLYSPAKPNNCGAKMDEEEEK